MTASSDKPSDKGSDKKAEDPSVKPSEKQDGATGKSAVEKDAKADAKPDGKADQKPGTKKDQAAATTDAKDPAKDKPSDPPMKRQSETSSSASGGGIMPVIWILVFVAVLIGGAYASMPIWGPKLAGHLPGAENDPTTQAALRKMAARIEQLESANGTGDAFKDLKAQREAVNLQLKALVTRVEQMEAALSDVRKMAEVASPPDGAAQATDSLNNLSSRLSSLESNQETLDAILKRIAELEDQTQAVDPELAAKITAMQGRLGEIESADQRGQRGQALVLAVGQLRDAVGRSQPFVTELESLSAIAGNGPEFTAALATLTEHAALGVSGLEQLRQDFNRAAAAAANARLGGEDAGWTQKTLKRLSGLVSVRRTGDAAPAGSLDASLSDAQEALDEGDLVAAVDALSGLGGSEKDALAPWLAKAKARIDVEKALAALHVAAVSLMAPGEG